MNIKIVLAGGCGQMGKQLICSFYEDREIEIVGVVDRNNVGTDPGQIAGVTKLGIKINSDLSEVILNSHPDVLVDFTCHSAACENINTAISLGIPSVVGTTGFSEDELKNFHKRAIERNIPLFIAPNFAIGAVLMMKFASMASRYFPAAEIIELHHNRKKDAPSGTSLTTARGMAENISGELTPAEESELLTGARGGKLGSIRIHSVRLPGLLAHQQVLLGGNGELLTICHDSINRECFMPGVIMAVKKVRTLPPGLSFGLDKLLEL